MNGVKARGVQGALAALLLLPAVASGRGPYAPPLTVSQYVARLDALVSAVEDGDAGRAPRSADLIAAVPRDWTVDGSTRVFEIPTDALRLELRAWMTNHDGPARRRLLAHLRTLRTDASLFDQPAPDVTSQRAQLVSILMRPEFQDVHGPTWLDRLEQRALALLERLLGGVMRRSDLPTITTIVVYALMASAVLLMGWSFVRFVRRRASAETLALGGAPIPPREWSRWLADAQAAAARGDWRDAVHLTYWCAVAFLEARGAWRQDRARTPREYVRLLPASSSGSDALGALTRRYEVIWYGTAPADVNAFNESIENLKQIGCPAA